MKALGIIVGLMMSLSCVSLSEFREYQARTVRLQEQIELLNQERSSRQEDMDGMQAEIEKMRQEMDLFDMAYDAATRDRLQINVEAALRAKTEIDQILTQNLQTQNKILALLSESREDRAAIAENRRQSEADNVIREFELLRSQWVSQLRQMENLVDEAAVAARTAQNEVRRAMIAAQEARDNSLTARQEAEKINDWIRYLRGLQEELEELEEGLKGAMAEDKASIEQKLAMVEADIRADIPVIPEYPDIPDYQDTLSDHEKRISSLERRPDSRDEDDD
jgi:chromosome segregation ATPase